MDQNLIFIMVGYIGTILSVIVFVSRTIGSLANKQQDENEKLAARMDGYVTRIVTLEKQLSHEEGASKTLKDMLATERQFQRDRDAQWQTERTAMRERLADLERQLNELKQHNQNKAGEITTLQETNAALQETNTRLQNEHDSLRRENAALETASANMTKRLNKQDTERLRLISEGQKRDQQLLEIQRKLADCEKQEQAETEPSDDSQEDAAA